MEPATLAAIGGIGKTALTIGSSLLGGMQASGAADNAQTAAQGTALLGSTNNALQNYMQQKAYEPYTNLGYSALPLYQWLATGVKPTAAAMTPEELAQLERLSARENELQQKYAEGGAYAGHNKKWYGTSLAQMKESQEKLARLNELKQKKFAYDSLGQMNDPMEMVRSNPLYALQQKLGEKSINRAAASRGMWNSSASLGQLNNFNESLAANERGRIMGDLGNALNIGRGGLSGTANNQVNYAQPNPQLGAASGLINAGTTGQIGNALGSLLGSDAFKNMTAVKPTITPYSSFTGWNPATDSALGSSSYMGNGQLWD